MFSISNKNYKMLIKMFKKLELQYKLPTIKPKVTKKPYNHFNNTINVLKNYKKH